MSTLTVSHGNRLGMTMVSNRFIDEYMRDANDAQVKIYLYLLRSVGSDLPVGISDIADYFNYTEKDVLRALKYWNKLHVITLLYNESQELTGIRLERLEEQGAPILGQSYVEEVRPARERVAFSEASTETVAATAPVAPKENSMAAPVAKPTLSLDQLRAFKERESSSELLFIVEQYIGKPLTPNDIQTVYFMTDVLQMSNDLIDYLVQYCVEKGKKDFRYMEKVALSWKENGISTPKQASMQAKKYDKNVYTIMNELGKTSSPTAREMEFINRWTKEYAFSLDVIVQACQRTVLATDKHRFEYADSILQSWYKAGVHTVQDIALADESFRKGKSTADAKATGTTSNAFTKHKQNRYDYADILEKIKVN